MSVKIYIESAGDTFNIKWAYEPEFRNKPKIYKVIKHINNIKKHFKDKTKHFTIIAFGIDNEEELFRGVNIEEISVDGVIYTDYKTLSEVLTPILYSSSSSVSNANTEALLQKIVDSYDTESFTICINDDPDNKVGALIKKSFFKETGLEDFSKREFYINGALVAAPSSFSYGTCGEPELKEFNFTLTPNLGDNTEDDYPVSIAGVLASDNYELISNNNFEGIEVSLVSWPVDGQVNINVYNNSGADFNSELTLILKQV